jgi:hypothetical protein
MQMSIDRATVLAGFGLLCLSACSSQPPTAAANTPEYYWTAAGASWSARDYAKSADHLEHLLDRDNPYAARAIPWRLVITSGMAQGYADLAERYALGARFNKADALAFRREATKYRTMAGRLALRFAQDADRLRDVPLGKVQLAFSFPAGNPGEPPLFTRIGSGIALSAADQDSSEAVAIQRGVLMSVCAAAGAPRDVAKAREILSGGAGASRELFGKAVADALKAQSELFARDKLDDPQKAEELHKRVELALTEGARVGSARIGLLVSSDQSK